MATRRPLPSLAFIARINGLICIGLSLLTVATGARPAYSAPPPNILILIAEDLSPRVGAYGDEVARTPNIDALAARSVRYTRAFTTAGVCAPSRAALITGQHQISFGAQHMRTSTGPLGLYLAQPESKVRAFPEIMRAHGYYTFTDRKLDYQFSGIRAGSGPFTIWDEENADDTAWRHRAAGQPFLGVINFFETHESGVMRQSGTPYSESHRASQAARRAITAQRVSVTQPEEVSLPTYLPDLPAVRRDLARHYDNIHLMDKRVGRILSALESDGLTKDTIVIWTADHGDGLPRSKRELYDSGTRVPLLIARPGQSATVDDRLVSFVDLAPTVLSWAGIPPPHWLHGHAIGATPRRYIYSSRDRIDEVMDRQRAIRSPRYRYIRSWHPQVPAGHALQYRDNIDMVRAWRAAYRAGELNRAQAKWFEPVGREQLYDVVNDPDELNNLIGNRAFEGVREDLSAALEAFLDRVGDTGEEPEAHMRERLLMDGALPVTPAPRVEKTTSVQRFISPIGASIGYQIADETRWRLYVDPLSLDVPVTQIKSIRYGWRESDVVRLDN